jgi:hypothetical protein
VVEGLDTIGSNHDGAAFTHQDGKFVLFSGKGGKCIILVSVELFSFYFIGSKLVRFLDKFEHSMLVNRHNPDHQNVPKFESAIFETFWRPNSCTDSLFLKLETSNFGYLLIF